MQLPHGPVVEVASEAEAFAIYREVFVEREYFRHGIVVHPGDCVFDVGANIGLFSLLVTGLAPGVRLHAFEPAPPLFAILQRNAAAHFPDARLHGCGIADRTGAAAFTFYPGTTQASTLHPFSIEQGADLLIEAAGLQRLAVPRDRALAQAERTLTRREIYEVELRPLSEVIAAEGVERIHLLKIDAEGSEGEALAGIRDEHWPRIDQIVLEVHNRQIGQGDDIEARLVSRGYEVFVEHKRTDPVVALLDIRLVYATRRAA